MNQSYNTLDTNGMKSDPIIKKSAYKYEKQKSIESFFGPMTLKRKDFFSNVKQHTPNNKKRARPEAMTKTYITTNGKNQQSYI